MSREPTGQNPALQNMLNIGTVLSKELEQQITFSAVEDENLGPFSISADTVATGRTCVIGSSGSGKSYTVGVLCEELCKCKVPFVIIDIEGEYSGLKEKYEAIWIGDDEKSDLKWSSSNIDFNLLAKFAPDCPPFIFDISEAPNPREKVSSFLLAIYREISERRTPYLVVLEEADRFIPQIGDRLPIFDEIARRGRKRGLGLMLCTQRPSLVDKNTLSQCTNQFIGKLVIKNDLQSVAQFFPQHGLPNQLTSLTAGEFYVLGGVSPEPVCVKIRTRETPHGGMTPHLNPTAVRESVADILSAFEGTVSANVSTSGTAPMPSIQVTTKPTVNSPVVQKKPEAPTMQALGLPVLVEQMEVPNLVKLEKAHKLFGQKETVGQVDLKYKPLVEVGVRKRGGFIMKKFETLYFLLDGLNGRLFQPGDRLSFQDGLERLLGLEEGQIIILKSLEADKDKSFVEISSSTGLTEDQLRRLLKGLEDQRLIRSSKVGRFKVYRRIMDMPKIDLSDKLPLELVPVSVSSSSSLEQPKINEAQVREIVKGMWSGADVESFRVFYYPLYKVSLALGSGGRDRYVDARTGKELQ